MTDKDISPTMLEIYERHYETLNEEQRVAFLLNLKREGRSEFGVLAQRWIEDPVSE